MDYDQPVTVLMRNGAPEQTTLGAILRRLLADPELVPGIGVVLADDNRLITTPEDFAALSLGLARDLPAEAVPPAANDP